MAVTLPAKLPSPHVSPGVSDACARYGQVLTGAAARPWRVDDGLDTAMRHARSAALPRDHAPAVYYAFGLETRARARS